MNNNTRVHLLIDGRVQGVCFRYYCQSQALKLGLTGWVRNLRDGRVEVTAEGNKESIANFVTWCHHGPAGAYVASCDETYAEPTEEFESFEIRF